MSDRGGVGSGTDSLHLALRACEIGPVLIDASVLSPGRAHSQKSAIRNPKSEIRKTCAYSR